MVRQPPPHKSNQLQETTVGEESEESETDSLLNRPFNKLRYVDEIEDIPYWNYQEETFDIYTHISVRMMSRLYHWRANPDRVLNHVDN